jgi:hypothetical protein
VIGEQRREVHHPDRLRLAGSAAEAISNRASVVHQSAASAPHVADHRRLVTTVASASSADITARRVRDISPDLLVGDREQPAIVEERPPPCRAGATPRRVSESAVNR